MCHHRWHIFSYNEQTSQLMTDILVASHIAKLIATINPIENGHATFRLRSLHLKD